MLIMRKT